MMRGLKFIPRGACPMALNVRATALRRGSCVLCRATSRISFRQISTTRDRKNGRDGSTSQRPLRLAQARLLPGSPEVEVPIVQQKSAKQRRALQRILRLGVDYGRRAKPNAPEMASSTDFMSPEHRYMISRHRLKETRGLGSVSERRYIPSDLIQNPLAMEDVTLELLMASQTHMGHNKSKWHPSNARYIAGIRQGIHIISLEVTAAHLRRAARIVEDVSYRGGLILYVGTRAPLMEIVTRASAMAGGCHLFTKWIPGSITNRDEILKTRKAKIVDHQDRELTGFRSYLNLARPILPDLVVCLNPLDNYTLLSECGHRNIPTIGVIDTDADPSWVSYAIPANDDSYRSLAVIGGALGRAGQQGRRRRLAEGKEGESTWETPPELVNYMHKEIKAAVVKRKEVMGRIRRITPFNEEEEKLMESPKESVPEDLSEFEARKILDVAAAQTKLMAIAESVAEVGIEGEAEAGEAINGDGTAAPAMDADASPSAKEGSEALSAEGKDEAVPASMRDEDLPADERDEALPASTRDVGSAGDVSPDEAAER